MDVRFTYLVPKIDGIYYLDENLNFTNSLSILQLVDMIFTPLGRTRESIEYSTGMKHVLKCCFFAK